MFSGEVVHNQQNLRVLFLFPSEGALGLLHFYVSALQQLGLQVRKEYILGKPNVSKWEWHLLFRSSLSQRLFLKKAMSRIFKIAGEYRPHLIITVKGDFLRPWIIHHLKKISGGMFFLLSPDNPWVHAVGKSQFWNSISTYDCIFTFAKFLVPGLYQMGAKRVERIPFAYDPEVHKIAKLNEEEYQIYKTPIAYLGTWGPTVEQWLRPLASLGLKIWGDNWDKAKPELRRCWASSKGNPGKGNDMSRACNGAKIVVNFLRSEHGCAHSMKTFELPACGAFVISTCTDEQLEFFPEGKSGVYFRTRSEMLDKKNFYLSNTIERETVRRSAFEGVQPHTYVMRAKTILDIYWDIRGAEGT
jgi:spore maturation protein CgeB